MFLWVKRSLKHELKRKLPVVIGFTFICSSDYSVDKCIYAVNRKKSRTSEFIKIALNNDCAIKIMRRMEK